MLVLLLLLTANKIEAPSSEAKIPEALKPWSEWVLQDQPDFACTHQVGEEERGCFFASQLELKLNAKGGSFTERVYLYRAGEVAIAGDAAHWPQDVRVNGKPATVIAKEERPHAVLPAGAYVVSGGFAWDTMPESIAVPEAAGLIALTVNNLPRPFVNVDDGSLWLQRDQEEEREDDSADIDITRRVDDDVPLSLTTRISLTIAGKARELDLPPVLPGGFQASSIASPLPARLEKDGKLRVQARPGQYVIEISARALNAPTELAPPAAQDPLPDEEVWVLASHPELRVVTVSGAASVDPQQTKLAADWKKLPAYRVSASSPMKLEQQQRSGDVRPPSQLTLSRTLWLDFTGHGYSVRDDISGTLSQSRLNMHAPIMLGRVSEGGQDRLITTAGDTRGVELRDADLHVRADSTISGERSTIPIGWDEDFQQVSANLHLPPGWRLLGASGVDHASGTWLDRWTLLDFFAVLIIILAISRLWSWRAAIIIGATIIMSFTENNAPQWVWGGVLLAEAFVRYAPRSRFDRWWQALRLSALAIFAVVLVPYLIGEARGAIHPVLEAETHGVEFNMPMIGGAAAPMMAEPGAAPIAEASEGGVEKDDVADAKGGAALGSTRQSAPKPQIEKRRARKEARAYATDLSSVVQTGAGIADWNWNGSMLTWSGPVKRSQEVHLYFLTPAVRRVLVGFELLFFAYAIALFARLPRAKWPRFLSVIAPALFLMFGASEARADYPPQPLLEQLKARLQKRPDCHPNCAESARLQLDVSSKQLTGRMQWSLGEATSVPLPGSAEMWSPDHVLVDGKAAEALTRVGGSLFVALSAGVHEVQFAGALPARSSLQIALPLKPHRVEVKAQGWEVAGIHEDGAPDDSIRLSRTEAQNENGGGLTPTQLPPFLKITRHLTLGLTWEMHTSVERQTPLGAAAAIALPLLPGENITSAGTHVQDGRVQFALAPQAEEASWDSVVTPSKEIVLQAEKTAAWSEVWIVDPSPTWHVETQGIPPLLRGTNAALTWVPWPGERVVLSITRPAAAAGQTLTIDHSRFEVSPGTRASDSQLDLQIRTSRGGEHRMQLPNGVEVEKLLINNVVQPIRLDNGSLALSLTPGAQNVALTFREDTGMQVAYRVPEVAVGSATVNADVIVRMPENRWILWVAGPPLGPAVLFWGVVVVLALAAFALGRTTLAPVRTHQWFLLGIGLAQLDALSAAVVFGLVLAFGARRRSGATLSSGYFDLLQIALVMWTGVSAVLLFAALHQGLLSVPEMDVSGHGSSASMLAWYADRTGTTLPRPFVLSLPLWIYKALMLAWALWLASFLLGFVRFAWESFTSGGVWKRSPRKTTAPPPTPTA